MNLSGIFNLPESTRSQGTGQTQASQNSGTASSSAASSATPNGGKTDQASLSAGGLAAALTAGFNGSASDVRSEKVANIGALIQAGTYHVSPHDVADKIMQGMFELNQR